MSNLLYTKRGVPYFIGPSVRVINKPFFNKEGLVDYLNSFDTTFEYDDYLEDSWEPSSITSGEAVSKFCGQLCYQSFSNKRTKNKDKDKYFTHILEAKHGSILESVSYSLLIWGISRDTSHELIRHRAGTAVSQASQRYISNIRFVERLSFQKNPTLHSMFEDRIDRLSEEFYALQEKLSNIYSSPGLSKTERIKKINQDSRAILPNETETSLVFTANVRAWRNILEQRASKFADVEIRRLANKIYEVLVTEEPLLFGDYIKDSLEDGTFFLETPYPKV